MIKPPILKTSIIPIYKPKIIKGSGILFELRMSIIKLWESGLGKYYVIRKMSLVSMDYSMCKYPQISMA